jgi:hypothetical protein
VFEEDPFETLNEVEGEISNYFDQNQNLLSGKEQEAVAAEENEFAQFGATFSKLTYLVYAELIDKIYALTAMDDPHNFNFKSPLNFLFARGDFYDFLQHFY